MFLTHYRGGLRFRLGVPDRTSAPGIMVRVINHIFLDNAVKMAP